MKTIRLIFLFALLISTSIAAQAASVTVGDLTYTTNTDGTAAVTGLANTSATEIVIPETITYSDTEYSVTSISGSAFNGKTNIISVSIGNNVKTINSYAFKNCSELSSLVIPANVTTIGIDAFASTGITELIIEDSDKTLTFTEKSNSNYGGIFNTTFENSPIKSLYINRPIYYKAFISGKYSVHSYCSPFYNLSNLKEVVLGDKITEIPDYLLLRCSTVEKVFILGENITIGKGALFNNVSNENQTTIPTLLLNTKSLCQYSFSTNFSVSTNSGSPTTFVKPTNLYIAVRPELIEDYTQDTTWGKYEIGNINERALNVNGFWYGIDLDSKTATLTFEKSSSLENYQSQKDVILNESFSFPELNFTLTNIGDYAFDHCWTLKSIDIPETVTSIGESAFGYCTSLRFVNIPSSVTSIGNDAFTGCSGLAEVTLNDGLEQIGDYAFFGCTGLDQISIPQTVETIGERAFMGMHWLNDVYVASNIPSEAPVNAFTENAYKNATLHVPAGSLQAYQSHPTWSKFLKISQKDDVMTGIAAVEEDVEQETEIYSLQGVRLSETDNLPQGVYVVRKGNRTRKIVVK